MNDIEKEFHKAIKSEVYETHDLEARIEQAASACYEIHRREMIRVLEGLKYDPIVTETRDDDTQESRGVRFERRERNRDLNALIAIYLKG